MSQFKVEFMIRRCVPVSFGILSQFLHSYVASRQLPSLVACPVPSTVPLFPSVLLCPYCTVSSRTILYILPSLSLPVPCHSDLSQPVLLSAELSCRLHVSPHTHTHISMNISFMCVCVYTLTCVNVYLQVASAWCVRGVCGVCVTVDVSNCCFVAGSSLGFHTLPQGILRLLRALRHLAATLSLYNSSTHCNINKYTIFQYCCCCTCRMC